MKIQCAHDELVDLHKIQPNPKNPNKHPENQITLLAKIIDYQGQRAPIVVSTRSGFIVKGHGRLDAIKKLGWEKAAVDFQDYESEAQEYADMVADNKIAELANSDDEFIKKTIIELEMNNDFDLDLLGIPDFNLMTVEEINKGDENSEWVGLPEFEPKDKDIKLIIIFQTELERELYVKENKIDVTSKMAGQWTSRL